jgi:hypothetical protein
VDIIFIIRKRKRNIMVTSKPSLALMDSGNASAASIALSFDNDDDSSESFFDEDGDHFEINGASKGEMTAMTEPDYEGEKGMDEEKEPPPEKAPEKRSGFYLWGIVAGMVALIFAAVVRGMMGGAPVDEDDVVGVTGMVNSAGGSGGGAGGGATGVTTSAQ